MFRSFLVSQVPVVPRLTGYGRTTGYRKGDFQRSTSRTAHKKKKSKKKEFWGGYKHFTLKDGTMFLARDEHDAELYRSKVEISN